MSFVELARKKSKKNFKIGFGSAADTKYELIDGAKALVKRPQKGFEGLESYQQAFREEYEKGFSLNNKNILAYRDFFKDSQGTGILMETGDFRSLEFILREKPAFTANKKVVDRIIQEIIKGVGYLHAHGISHLNLNLENILLTENYTVKIINPVCFYLNCKPSVLTLDGAFTAPELTSENGQPDFRSDIYSIGKIIDAIYAYSSLPIKYKTIVKKSTEPLPVNRYQNIAQMQKAVSAGGLKQKTIKTLVVLCAAAIVCGFVYLTVQDFTEPDTHYVIPAKNSQHTLEVIKNNPYDYNIINDSVANSMTEDEMRQQQAYDKKAGDIFKKQFAKKADAIISSMYSAPNMNGEEKAFKSMSTKGFGELEKIQNELIKQYNIDPNQAARLAQDVINNLTQQKMNELQSSKMGNGQ